jgi:hypothetical protein
MKRTGPLRDRLALRASRSLGVAAWRLGERLGIDVAGATEGPRFTMDAERRETFESLIAAARAGDGTIDAASCPYPLHELLTYLVVEHDLLLHGSNDAALGVLEPKPARDYETELTAVVACDDGIWPIFYAVVARDRVREVFTACTHLGRPPSLRRFYMFAIGADSAAAASWTRGAVYALPRAGFRREWGHEWVRAEPVRPLLRVPVGPEDFPLHESVIGSQRPTSSAVSADTCAPQNGSVPRLREFGLRRGTEAVSEVIGQPLSGSSGFEREKGGTVYVGLGTILLIILIILLVIFIF